jgi:hypothetical protein
MNRKMPRVGMILALTIMLPAIVMSQGQIKSLVLSGHPDSVPVRQLNGKNYVEIEALARTGNGSLSFNGDQIVLTLPPPGENGAASGEEAAAKKTGFSREFLRAGIESLSTIREWHTALSSAIENQFPLEQSWLTQYQELANTDLRLAQVAATTDADRNAAQLIANVFEKRRQLNDKYVAQRASLSYISPDALKNDPMDQNSVACGRFLGAMMASGQFADDGTCH